MSTRDVALSVAASTAARLPSAVLIRQRGKFGKLISLTDSWLVGWARRIRAEAPVRAKEENLVINFEMNYFSFKSEATVKALTEHGRYSIVEGDSAPDITF